MQIWLNGVAYECRPGVTVAELLARMETRGRRVAVEVNGEIVPKSRHGEYHLAVGDRVELIGAIGGG